MPYIYIEPKGMNDEFGRINNAVKIIKKLKKNKKISDNVMIGMWTNGCNDVEITVSYNDDAFPSNVLMGYLDIECSELIQKKRESEMPDPSI